MPSTVPAVKAGLRNWLRTQTGLRPQDGVYVSGVPLDPEQVKGDVVVLASVLGPQEQPVMWPTVSEENPTLTGQCLATRPGTGDAVEDAVRVAAYALFDILKSALMADPSAGGVIPGPGKGLLTQGDLTESPGDDNGSGLRRASVRWLLNWTSDY